MKVISYLVSLAVYDGKGVPISIQAPFSPIDVIEEYTRPARYVENYVEKVLEPLSEPEYVHFEEVGTLEAFNTDGIRSLIQTIKIPNIKEKTLRYPTHIEYIKVLKAAGFFSNDKISVGNQRVKPIDLTNKLLFKKWKLADDEKEFTVMRVIIEGVENDKKTTYTYNLYDKFDEKLKLLQWHVQQVIQLLRRQIYFVQVNLIRKELFLRNILVSTRFRSNIFLIILLKGM